jgi:hypothetical protein
VLSALPNDGAAGADGLGRHLAAVTRIAPFAIRVEEQPGIGIPARTA